MKKIIALMLALIAVFTIVATVSTSVTAYEMVKPETNVAMFETNATSNFFDSIIVFFRNIFYSKITFDTDGGSEIADYYALKFKKITPPADPVKEGHTFAGWSTDIPSRMPWNNLTIKAIWTTNSYRINWIVDGKTAKSESYLYGEKITEYIPEEKEGFAFAGWNAEIPETMPAKDLTFITERQVNKYNVYRNVDGNTVNVEIYSFGDVIGTFMPEAKKGYTFVGWEPELPATMPAESLTVNAKWEANKYNVFWVSDGEVVKTEVYSFGEKINEYAPDIKEGYEFTGWDNIPETMPDKDVTITAIYSKITEVIVAESDEEFNSTVMSLVSEGLNDENFDPEQALEDEFYTCRVVAKCSDFALVDFNEFEADTIVMNDDGTVVLQFANRDLAEQCQRKLNEISSVEFAEADAYIEAPKSVEIEEIPEVSNSIWGEKYINADKYAYYLENNGLNKFVTVAVVDSGVDMDHPYLKGRILQSGRNCFNTSLAPEDDSGHGTHVAGIIVNCTNNLNVKIMPIKSIGKFTNEEGQSYFAGTHQSIVDGINHAAAQNVDVINLSLESPYNTYSTMVEHAINDAVAKGITVVVAAGNGSVTVLDDGTVQCTPVDTQFVTPASMENVIVVAALDESGNKGSFSNYGTSVDVIAPGVKVPSSYLGGTYAYMGGTSQAAPHIAAMAAMFKLAYPDYTPAEIEALIKELAVDKGPAGRDDYYGEGCPNMYNAIPDCTVVFDTNGGNSLSPATTKNSSSITLPVPEKGYTVTWNANGGSFSTKSTYYPASFDGWYTAEDFSGKRYYDGESMMLLKNETLYAKWRNGMMGSVSNPTKSGYKFVGWYTEASDGTKYTSGTTISDNITLYAHWEQYSLKFNLAGGSNGPSTVYGYDNVTIPSTKPKRSGYEFKGWGTYSGTSTVAYKPGNKYNLTSNVTLYAVWGKASVYFTSFPDPQPIKASYYNTAVLDGERGFVVDLPTPDWENVNDGTGSSGYNIYDNDSIMVGFYGNNQVLLSQPGKIEIDYQKNGYISKPYVYEFKLVKTTTNVNNIRSSPSTSSSIIGTVKANKTVNILEVCYTGNYNGKTSVWGKVSEGGKTGWIILFTP